MPISAPPVHGQNQSDAIGMLLALTEKMLHVMHVKIREASEKLETLLRPLIKAKICQFLSIFLKSVSWDSPFKCLWCRHRHTWRRCLRSATTASPPATSLWSSAQTGSGTWWRLCRYWKATVFWFFDDENCIMFFVNLNICTLFMREIANLKKSKQPPIDTVVRFFSLCILA